MNALKDNKLFPRILRGDIYYVDFGNQPGSVVHGVRPAMVVQNDTGNWHAPTLIVAAITSEIKKLRQPTHIVIGARFGLPYESMLLLEQLFTIDKTMLLTYVGTADDEFLELVDKAVAVSVGVHPTICNTRYEPNSKQGRATRRRSNNGVQKSKIC